MTTSKNQKQYIAQLTSGFELVINANNWKEAKRLAQRAGKDDKVISVKYKSNK